MRRREFLKTTTAATAAVMTAPYIHPARAQDRNDTLLTLSESGPNNLDIMGVGTNRPGYEASWNTHDRLVTFGSKPDANGVDHYDYTKIEPELAESWDLHDMSVTFTLRSRQVYLPGGPRPASRPASASSSTPRARARRISPSSTPMAFTRRKPASARVCSRLTWTPLMWAQ